MRRAFWIIALLACLPLFAVILALLAANTQSGREWIEQTVATLSSGQTTLEGLSGRFPDTLRLGRIGLRDADGPWLEVDDLELDWSPKRLLAGVAEIDRLEAKHISLQRLPAPSPDEATPAATFSPPVAIVLRLLRVARLDIAQPVAGKAASIAINGTANLASLQQGAIDLALKRLDGEGTYTLQGSLKEAFVRAKLSVQEPPQGLISSFANVQELDALSAEATVEGPISALQTRLELALGPLFAKLQGGLDLVQHSADVTVSAKAPAMQLRPGLSWRAISLDAKVQGPFARPFAVGELRIDNLNAGDTALRSIALNVQGDAGEVRLAGELAGLRLPGPRPDVLESAPVALQAAIRLDAKQRPVVFKLKHPLIAIEGKADTAADLQGELVMSLPDLKPFAALAGLDAQGKTTLNLHAGRQAETVKLDVDGTLGLNGGNPLLLNLLGNNAKIGISAMLQGEDIALTRFSLDGKALAVSTDGKFAKRAVNFNWNLSFKDLAAIMAGASGQIIAQGQIAGPLGNFGVTADLNGKLATKELASGPVAAKLRVEGLPLSPSGQVTAHGLLGGAPLELMLALKANANGSIELSMDRADWKSANAKARLTLPKGADLPVGKIDLGMTHLEELRPLLGQALTGSVTATLETTLQGNRPQAGLRLDARNAGLAGSALAGQSTVAVTIDDPIRHPVLDGEIKLDGISAGALSGSAQVDLAGPLEKLGLNLSATVHDVAGAELQLGSTGSLDAKAKQAAITELQASWKNETLELLAPVRIRFADGISVDRLRLGLGQAELALTGQVSPTLNLTANLDQLPAQLAALFVPDLVATGTLHGDARLTGTPAHPIGTIAIETTDIQLQTGAGRALPAARLAATSNLDGTSAQIDTRLSAGNSVNLSITGEIPLVTSGQFDLHAIGGLDLKLLDPLLTAQGRRLRGQISLDARLTGTLTEPHPKGSMQLTGGDLQDFAIGAHLTQITALLQADGGAVRLAKLEGRAGQGTMSASGSLDLLGEGMPVNVSLSASKARLMADDRLTVDMNADLTVKGQAAGALAVIGSAHIIRAEILLPERMPTKIAVLNVIRSGAPPPPPPAPGPDIALDLSMNAPGEIFVRGRGLNAELGGRIHVRGTADKPQPDGGFSLRRGQFTLAGQTLTFSKGQVGFDGGSLADPSLNFIANTTSGSVTATLTVSGTASNPKIKLSSDPELPQDEVLAQLLYGRNTGSLSPIEMVQIASALASLTGITSGIGDPLDSVRKGLGLDRLTIGGASPALEAGHYVAPGVYVGAKQGISGTATQATVQIDITKGLKLEGSAGTGTPASTAASASSTNSVGLIYQHEY